VTTNDVCQRLDRACDLIHWIEGACRDAGQEAIPHVLAEHRPALYRAMHYLGAAINSFLAGEPPADAVDAVQAQVTGALRPLSHTSPFFHHSYYKLRGYPGDFETIEVIYNNRPTGTDLPGWILDDYYLATPPAQAVRNRLGYLVQRLGGLVRDWAAQGAHPVRLLSLGSGSARELVSLTADPAFAHAAEVTCVDLDPGALAYARQRLDGRLRQTVRWPVHWVNANAVRLAGNGALPGGPFHVIYAAGLFDYLKAPIAARLMSYCHSLLVPGGLLIAGNFSLETPANDRILIEWLLDWHLLYRDEADYRAIVAATPFRDGDLAFEYEALRANLFAVLCRR
jgi:extracellular factor (EF) 3-hydroxypalmitic acid methyl ester biosynthesis protein